MASQPHWAAPEAVRTALSAWAQRQGLSRTDALLPAASDRLHLGTHVLAPQSSLLPNGPEKGVARPGRFSEGTWAGRMASGLDVQIGHHTYLESERGSSNLMIYIAKPLTAVVAFRPDLARVVNAATWDGTTGWSIEPAGLPISLPELPAANATVTVRDGYLVAESPDYLPDGDWLCWALDVTSHALDATRQRSPELQPGEPVADRAPLADLPAVAWPRPPADTREAVAAYRDAGRDAKRAGGGFGRLLKKAGVNVMHGVGEDLALARNWGVEAFVREYAPPRHLRVTDDDALRRSIVIGTPGHPRRSLQGHLPGGLEGHLLLWQDPTGPLGHQLYDIAAVAGRTGAPPLAAPGFHAWRAGPWLVVAQPTGEEGHSAVRLDALAHEAARLCGPA